MGNAETPSHIECVGCQREKKRLHFAMCFHLFILICAHLTSESQAAVYHCACQEVLSVLNRVSFVLAGAWVQKTRNFCEHQSIHMPRVHHSDFSPSFFFSTSASITSASLTESIRSPFVDVISFCLLYCDKSLFCQCVCLRKDFDVVLLSLT